MKRIENRDLPESILAALVAGEPILVADGRRIVGLLVPLSAVADFPTEIRRKLYLESSAEIGARLDALGVSEEEIERDISGFRRTQNERRRRKSGSKRLS